MLDTNSASLLLAVIIIATLIVIGLIFLRLANKRRALQRPDWSKMMADTEYFSKAMRWVLKRRGFDVLGSASLPVPYIEGPREVLFHLRKGKKIYAALCGRWVAVVGSDQVLRFQEQLSKTRSVQAAMIITTSKFTPSAYERAEGTPLTLHDGVELKKWVES